MPNTKQKSKPKKKTKRRTKPVIHPDETMFLMAHIVALTGSSEAKVRPAFLAFAVLTGKTPVNKPFSSRQWWKREDVLRFLDENGVEYVLAADDEGDGEGE